MRKLLLSSLAATTMVGSALAADLRPPPPYVPPAPVATWTGLYIGINGGGIWMNNRDFVTTGTDFGANRLCALVVDRRGPRSDERHYNQQSRPGFGWRYLGLQLAMGQLRPRHGKRLRWCFRLS